MDPVVFPCTHGVNHGALDRRVYAPAWGLQLRTQSGGGRFLPLPWSSRDSALLDGAASYMLPGVLDGHLDEILYGFEGSPGLFQLMRENKGPIVWIAHSWGTVLAYLTLARNGWTRRVRLICLGSPYTNPSPGLGLSLRLRGRAPAWPTGRGLAPVFVQNRDDKVCALSRYLPTLPPPNGTRIVWAEHADDQRVGVAQEHEPGHYFGTAAFQLVLSETLASFRV